MSFRRIALIALSAAVLVVVAVGMGWWRQRSAYWSGTASPPGPSVGVVRPLSSRPAAPARDRNVAAAQAVVRRYFSHLAAGRLAEADVLWADADLPQPQAPAGQQVRQARVREMLMLGPSPTGNLDLQSVVLQVTVDVSLGPASSNRATQQQAAPPAAPFWRHGRQVWFATLVRWRAGEPWRLLALSPNPPADSFYVHTDGGYRLAIPSGWLIQPEGPNLHLYLATAPATSAGAGDEAMGGVALRRSPAPGPPTAVLPAGSQVRSRTTLVAEAGMAMVYTVTVPGPAGSSWTEFHALLERRGQVADLWTRARQPDEELAALGALRELLSHFQWTGR